MHRHLRQRRPVERVRGHERTQRGRGGDRVRATFDRDCPGLDFYSGFYLKPSADGQICADRDMIRTRSGDSCEISGFRRLVAKR